MDIESFRAVILTSSTYRLAGHGFANLTATYDWHSRTSLAVLIPRIGLLDCPKYRFLESFEDRIVGIADRLQLLVQIIERLWPSPVSREGGSAPALVRPRSTCLPKAAGSGTFDTA